MGNVQSTLYQHPEIWDDTFSPVVEGVVYEEEKYTPANRADPFPDSDAPYSSQAKIIRAQNQEIKYLHDLLAKEWAASATLAKRLAETEEENHRLTAISEGCEPLARAAYQERDQLRVRIQDIEAEHTEALESLRVEAEARLAEHKSAWQQEIKQERQDFFEQLRKQEQESTELVWTLREALDCLRNELDARSSRE